MTRLAVALLGLLLAWAVPAAAAPSLSDCIERNLVRYATPERAAVSQYVDIVAACERALAPDAEIRVTSDGRRGPRLAGEEEDAATPDVDTSPTSPSSGAPPIADGTDQADPPGATRRPGDDDGVAPAPPGSRREVARALGRAEPETGGLLPDGGSLPTSLLVIAIFGLALPGAALGLRLWRRTR